jgi:dUTP pyrophosphatase
MRILVKTGLAVELPKDTVLLIYPRSGLAAKQGITLANCVGVIDSDYRGEILIALTNQSNKPYVIKNGERVAQGVVHQLPPVRIIEANELTVTERGVGGFGSTN